MPTWNAILDEILKQQETDIFALDSVRRKYLLELHNLTNRNVIAYYSGFLDRNYNDGNLNIDDKDMSHFMRVVQGLDRSKGLDLILHTPGGDIAATEAIVCYLRSMFGTDIRAIIPQLAMSCGTMIACSTKEIIMGKHSSLGPIDPQILGWPAQNIIKEFKRAVRELDANPNSPGTYSVWKFVVEKYPSTILTTCEHGLEWADTMVKDWLISNMFASLPNPATAADTVVDSLGGNHQMKAHNRHISAAQCKGFGLNISDLESDQPFQEAVLSVHHAYMHSFSSSKATKIVENHMSQSTILTALPA